MGYSKRRTTRPRASRVKNTRTNRVGKMVNGHLPMTYPERLLSQGAPYSQIVSSLVQNAGMVSKLINSESHYHDYATAGATIDTSGTVFYISGIAQGDGVGDRQGNSILGQDLSYRLGYQLNGASTLNFIRVILFVDKECNGATPAVGELLERVHYTSGLKLTNGKRFAVIKDYSFSLDSATARTSLIKDFVKLPFHIKYQGATAGITDGDNNQVFCMMISNAASNYPSVDVAFRVKWHDN